MNQLKLFANWDGEQYRTEEKTGFDWRSEDGDNWVTGDGLVVECEEFERATIEMIGGPRDGERVG